MRNKIENQIESLKAIFNASALLDDRHLPEVLETLVAAEEMLLSIPALRWATLSEKQQQAELAAKDSDAAIKQVIDSGNVEHIFSRSLAAVRSQPSAFRQVFDGVFSVKEESEEAA